MKEAEWLACTDSERMAGYLLRCKRFKIRKRKLRLFGCACVRRIWDRLDDPRSRAAVEMAEQYADRRVRAKDLDKAFYAAIEAVDEGQEAVDKMDPDLVTLEVLEGLSFRDAATSCAARDLDNGVIVVIRFLSGTLFGRGRKLSLSTLRELKHQADLLREIFGNLFRPTRIKPSWLKWNNGTVMKMAQGLYDDYSFDRLPLLADALEEAGCTNEDILTHCRGPGPHVRGCWVVDLLLGKA